MTFSPDGNEKFRMVALWNAGQTLAQIATTFGCSASLVAATIKSLSSRRLLYPCELHRAISLKSLGVAP